LENGWKSIERMRSLSPCHPMFGESIRIIGGLIYYSSKAVSGSLAPPFQTYIP
jgi:hypothetical protein